MYYYITQDGKRSEEDYHDAGLFDLEDAARLVLDTPIPEGAIIPDASGKWLVVEVPELRDAAESTNTSDNGIDKVVDSVLEGKSYIPTGAEDTGDSYTLPEKKDVKSIVSVLKKLMSGKWDSDALPTDKISGYGDPYTEQEVYSIIDEAGAIDSEDDDKVNREEFTAAVQKKVAKFILSMMKKSLKELKKAPEDEVSAKAAKKHAEALEQIIRSVK